MQTHNVHTITLQDNDIRHKKHHTTQKLAKIPRKNEDWVKTFMQHTQTQTGNTRDRNGRNTDTEDIYGTDHKTHKSTSGTCAKSYMDILAWFVRFKDWGKENQERERESKRVEAKLISMGHNIHKFWSILDLPAEAAAVAIFKDLYTHTYIQTHRTQTNSLRWREREREWTSMQSKYYTPIKPIYNLY